MKLRVHESFWYVAGQLRPGALFKFPSSPQLYRVADAGNLVRTTAAAESVRHHARPRGRASYRSHTDDN